MNVSIVRKKYIQGDVQGGGYNISINNAPFNLSSSEISSSFAVITINSLL